MRKHIAILVLFASCTGAVRADYLWDNGLTPNGFNGRAISPPSFEIRVADDFALRTDFHISNFRANVIEDSVWEDGGEITVKFYADAGDRPGAVVATHTGEFDRRDTGDEYFGRRDYEYTIEGMDIFLDAGTYWVGIRNDLGGGAGTNYWMTSDGGPDGKDSSTGYISLDGGNSWVEEGAGWHHAFAIELIPEPSTWLLLALGGLGIFRRRR